MRPARNKKRRVQRKNGLPHHGLTRTQGKTGSAHILSPPLVLLGTAPKNNVVTVDAERYITGDRKTEGEVVLETQQREAEEVPHKLPTLLWNNATSRIMNLCPKTQHRITTNRVWNEPSTRKDPRKDHLGYGQRQIISGTLVIATNKNLTLLFLKGREPPALGLPPQQPLLVTEVIVEESMERTKDRRITAGHGNAAILASSLDNRVSHGVLSGKTALT
jgi:hypothetical protein